MTAERGHKHEERDTKERNTNGEYRYITRESIVSVWRQENKRQNLERNGNGNRFRIRQHGATPTAAKNTHLRGAFGARDRV